MADTISDLAILVGEDFRSAGVPAEFAALVAQQLCSEWATAETIKPSPGTFGALIGRYAIRKDDLKVFDALTEGLKAAAGVGFFFGNQPTLAAKVVIGVAISKVIRSIFIRGVVLDRETVHVLTIVRCNSGADVVGISASDVLSIVQRTTPGAELSAVQRRLEYLRSVSTPDGGTTTLASPDAEGRWRSHA